MTPPALLAPDPLHPPRSPAQRLAVVLLLALASYVAMRVAGPADWALRIKLMRYASLLGGAVLCVATPHALAPDPRVPLVQVLNRAPTALLRYHLRAWAPLAALVLLPLTLAAYFDVATPGAHLGAKTLHLAQALLVTGGAGLYVLSTFAVLGPTAQAWQEGRAGGWYRTMRDETGAGFAVPTGLVPALWTTTRGFVVIVLAVASGGYLGQRAPAAMWVPGAAVAGWALLRLARLRLAYDRHFYHTNALYREVLGGARLQAEAYEPVAYDALYWVPRPWRATVWAGLRQLERRLPLGRYVALGHALVWVLLWQGAPAAAVTGVLALLVAGQNAAVYALATPDAAPPAFQLTLRPVRHWIAARFFVNVRWTLPLALSLGAVALVGSAFTWGDVLLWAALNVAVALAVAAGVTLATEGAYRRRFT